MNKTNIYMGLDLSVSSSGIAMTLNGRDFFYWQVSSLEISGILNMIKIVFGESKIFAYMEKVSGKWSRGKASCSVQIETESMIKSMWPRQNKVQRINVLTWRKEIYGTAKIEDAKGCAVDYVKKYFDIDVEHDIAEAIILAKMSYDENNK